MNEKLIEAYRQQRALMWQINSLIAELDDPTLVRWLEAIADKMDETLDVLDVVLTYTRE